MADTVFNIKTLLEIICRITNTSANKLAEQHLRKDPAMIVRWKNGHVVPNADDLKIIVEFAARKPEGQKVAMRIEIENLLASSAQCTEFKDVIQRKKEFNEFLLEALSISVMKMNMQMEDEKRIAREKQIASEILADIACIDSRLDYSQNHKPYDDQSLQMKPQKVEAFREVLKNLPFKIEMKDELNKIEQETGLNCKHIQSFYDEIAELSDKYDSFVDFLTAASNGIEQKKVISIYIELAKLNMDIMRNNSHIAHIKGLLALSNLKKVHENTYAPLKSLSHLEPKEMVDSQEIARYFSDYVAEYEKLADEKKGLAKKLKTVKEHQAS